MIKEDGILMGKNCLNCGHRMVCRYLDAYNTLSSMGPVTFSCPYYLGAAARPERNSLKRFLPQEKDQKIQEHIPEYPLGICSICHKVGKLRKCERCGREVCNDCAEISVTLDIDTGKNRSIFLCRECSEKEDSE